MSPIQSVSENTYNPFTVWQDYCPHQKDKLAKAQTLAAKALCLHRTGQTEQARPLWNQAIQLIGSLH